jgi:hypothetical protein
VGRRTDSTRQFVDAYLRRINIINSRKATSTNMISNVRHVDQINDVNRSA